MRTGLRTKIILITVLTPLTLGLAAFITVHRNVRQHVDSTSIHENLEHSASVFESMLAVRLRALEGGGRVIAQDPRFFSLVMLGPDQRDARFVATVKGMSREFNRITATDLFEVFDRRGRLLASVGDHHTEPGAREALLKLGLRADGGAGVLAQGASHYQVAVIPVRADGRVVGALLLGASVDEALAKELRTQMRSEVTFLSGGVITGTTLEDPKDRSALLATLKMRDTSPQGLANLGVIKVRGGKFTYLTLIGEIPNARMSSPQLYVMQRSYDPETAFLRRMQQDLGLLALLALLMALVTGLALSEQIIRPIRTLVEGARQMQRGNFDAPVVVRNRDEIGYLAERFRAMRERERAYVQSLEEAARVKSEFISVASHELRTPISVIQGYRDLLAEGSLGEVSPRQQQALHAIRDCLVQLTKVAEDATQVAQIEGERVQIQPREIPVTPIVGTAISLAVTAAGSRSVNVTTELPVNFGTVWGDHERLVETLAHLIGNGIRFTPDGGRVVVRGLGDDQHLVIQVQDTGVGIAADRLDRLFDRSMLIRDSKHHRTSRGLEFNSSGLGFGLAIARAIVEAHGGTIDAQSRPNEGTTITMRLPRRPVDTLPLAA